MGKPNILVVAFLIVGSLTAGGCQRGPVRYAIEGTVTLDGKSLDGGSINFRPVERTPGPTAGAEIKDGKFVIPREGGLLPGKFRVEITASRPGKNVVLDEIFGREVPAYEQYLPARYNTRSELHAEVGESKSNHFDFELFSTP